MTTSDRSQQAILADVRRLAIEYYAVTGKPLGVTGEIAECEAAEKLELRLVEARTAGYDAIRIVDGLEEKIQIKGRRFLTGKPPYRGRVPKINLTKPFDYVVLVLITEDFKPYEIWEASRDLVVARLVAPGSKARNERGSMGISQFKSIATRVWSVSESRHEYR